jgi:CRISP-associated protein Cas1
MIEKGRYKTSISLLYLSEPGTGLTVHDGLLIVKTFNASTIYKPREHRLQCVILAARGFVTTDALAWLTREHVAALVLHEGEFLTMVDCGAGKLARRELAIRKRQMECVLDPKRRLAAARELIKAKLDTLKLGSEAYQTFARKLAKTQSIEDAMVMEAEAGAIYWRRWKGQELAFKDGTAIAFDARARSWSTGRLGETGRQFSNRFALHPINAMLNYAGAIVVAQCGRACTGLGLDPAFGVLHSTRPGMVALAWDVYELLRVRTEAAVFSFAGTRKFDASEFKIMREPKAHVRFGKELGRGLAAHTMKAVPFRLVVKTCRNIMELL